MFKIYGMVKRKRGTTMEQMVDYYETRHVPLGMEIIPNLAKYVRHFIRPYGTGEELPYDVITELGFADREQFERGMACMSAPDAAARLAEDEDRLFERSSIRVAIVEDCESDLGQAAAD